MAFYLVGGLLPHMESDFLIMPHYKAVQLKENITHFRRFGAPHGICCTTTCCTQENEKNVGRSTSILIFTDIVFFKLTQL